MIKATINSIPVEVPEGTSILAAAKAVQMDIPALCKHMDLESSAACGICVVKVRGRAKMLRACCTSVENGMEIITHDPEIVKVRRTVLELILSNHPNDCLNCGRNNDCELQRLAANFGIRKSGYPKKLRDLPIDSSTKTIVLEPQKCILCGRCVNVCQFHQNVWALSFINRGINTHISPAGEINLADSPCVRCGQCSNHCPTGAITEYDETEKVWSMLRDPDMYCVAQIAPAVRVAIGEAFGYLPGANLTRKLTSALKRLGFKAVFDTSLGADITIVEEASEFIRRFGDPKATIPLITSCCPAWVDYMEKYYPDMIAHFSSCKSPHEIIGVIAKTYYAQQHSIPPSKIRVISIMPCTAKKYEISRTDEMFASGYQDIDVSLTTRELARMIKQTGIDFTQLPGDNLTDVMEEYSGAGVIFGNTGGVMEAALRTANSYLTGKDLEEIEIQPVRGLKGVKEGEIEIGGNKIRVAVAHGLGNVGYILDKVRKAKETGQEPPYHFIEVMACEGGCIAGGGQPYGVTDELRKKRAEAIYWDDREKQVRYSHKNPTVIKLYEEFLGKPLGEKSHSLLHTEYKERKVYVK
jgi:NADH-quinone oxidoreductase subunit G